MNEGFATDLADCVPADGNKKWAKGTTCKLRDWSLAPCIWTATSDSPWENYRDCSEYAFIDDWDDDDPDWDDPDPTDGWDFFAGFSRMMSVSIMTLPGHTPLSPKS